jgi:hypothetical protein
LKNLLRKLGGIAGVTRPINGWRDAAVSSGSRTVDILHYPELAYFPSRAVLAAAA